MPGMLNAATEWTAEKITCSLSFRKSGLNPGSLYVKNVATDSISNELNNPRKYKLINTILRKAVI